MREPSRAVFLSYASQDAAPAARICDALQAGGIEVWFDQSELRGGDDWDQQIRKKIHDCALFIPVISANTQKRSEGYFRLEWRLAEQRTHLMGRSRTFLVPVCIDDTPDVDTDAPDSFLAVQWTRLPAGETPSTFVSRISQLLSKSDVQTPAFHPPPPSAASMRRSKLWPLLIAVVVLLGLGYVVLDKFVLSKRSAATFPGESATFDPPARSIAVLPFVNMSADKEQEYFSDGLTEELLNSLAQINELQVAARTSAFSFKGTHTDIGTIARKLNVAAVLEGSVRRSGNTLRITAQLINSVTGFHLWSHTYDRDLGDVLTLETEIAGAVAGALKVSLLGEEATKIELGGTRNPAAFDAYLRGRKVHLAEHGIEDIQTAIAAYTEAIGLDPLYANAFAGRSIALNAYADKVSGPDVRDSYDKSQADALKALALAPDLAEGHLALAFYFETGALDFIRAETQYEEALARAPGNARAIANYAVFAVYMGRTQAGIVAARRAVVLDPLNRGMHTSLGVALYSGRQNKEAIDSLQEALTVDPEYPQAYANRGLVYYGLGDFERARDSCERNREFYLSQMCLAVTYNKLGRHADAESIFARMTAGSEDAVAYQCAQIYAQWGNQLKALEWLDTAMRQRDSGLEALKTDPLMEPLRKEPRFQAMLRELKFPD